MQGLSGFAILAAAFVVLIPGCGDTSETPATPDAGAGAGQEWTYEADPTVRELQNECGALSAGWHTALARHLQATSALDENSPEARRRAHAAAAQTLKECKAALDAANGTFAALAGSVGDRATPPGPPPSPEEVQRLKVELQAQVKRAREALAAAKTSLRELE